VICHFHARWWDPPAPARPPGGITTVSQNAFDQHLRMAEPLAEDFFYDAAELAAPSVGGLPPAACDIHASFGVPSSKIDNLLYLDEVPPTAEPLP